MKWISTMISVKVLFKFITIFLACESFLFASSFRNRVEYVESNDVIANPERGLQKYSITNSQYYSSPNYSNLDQLTLTSWRTGADKVTVIFRYFLMDAFLNQEISDIYLDNIERDFDIIRAAGLKCLVRFSYSNAQSTDPQQPAKSQILSHIIQIAPILENNSDVIVAHQAGFLGTWGEWYYTNSTEFGTDGSIDETQWQSRKEIIDAMLQGTPQTIPLQVRYPEIKMKMYGEALLNESSAYTNTPNARIGFFNDAFLNNWGDMGTFSVSSQDENPMGTEDYIYLSNETKYTPMSGETNGLNPPRTNGENALLELDSCNWTNLNRDFYEPNITNWINSGHFDSMIKRLGYRFVLLSSDFVIHEKELRVNIEVSNSGFARLVKQRDAYLVLLNGSERYDLKLSSDPRTWENEVTLVDTLNLSSIPFGTYTTFINLPDPILSLRSEYSVRFANENLWNDSLGMNSLNQEVVVKETSNSLSVKTLKDFSINFNSTNQSITLYQKYCNQMVLKLSFFDSKGRLCKSFSITQQKSLFSLSDLKSGVYYCRVTGSHGEFSKKILLHD